MMINDKKRHRGFTLIELLAVVSILLLLVALLIPSLKKAMQSARLAACASNLHQIVAGLNAFAIDNDRYYPAHVDVDNTNASVRLSTYALNETDNSGNYYFGSLPPYYSVHKFNDYQDLAPGVNPMWRCPEGYAIDSDATAYYPLYCNTLATLSCPSIELPKPGWGGMTPYHQTAQGEKDMLTKMGDTMYFKPSTILTNNVNPGKYNILASDFCARINADYYMVTNHISGNINKLRAKSRSPLNYATTSGTSQINYAFTDGSLKRFTVRYPLIGQRMYMSPGAGIGQAQFIFPKAWQQQ